jgi:ParB/RepB/Spo0J family partition protein
MTMSRNISIELIDADPNQPRRHFDTSALQELADSLAADGQLVPITVRPVGNRFVIVQGERRWRAAQLAGLTTLRAEVSDVDEDTAYMLALIENVQRADLTPLEETTAYERLIANGYNQTELAKRIGKSQSYIAQKLRLLKLPPPVLDDLHSGGLMEGHARQLLRLEESDTIQKLGERAVEDGWTVNRLWYEVTLNLLVLKPSRDYKFRDLVDFAKKLEPYENGGEYAEHCSRAYFALGDILNFSKKVWEKYKLPDLGRAILEVVPLSEIRVLRDLDRDLNRTGHDIRNLLELAELPEDRFEVLLRQIFDGQTVRETEALQRELFDMVHAEIMSRDIGAGAAEGTPRQNALGAWGEVLR